MLPCARHSGLQVRDEGDVVVVYDVDRAMTHRLTKATAAVWRRCDGRTPIPVIARTLAGALRVPSDELLVWLALERLAEAELLEDRSTKRRPVRPSPLRLVGRA